LLALGSGIILNITEPYTPLDPSALQMRYYAPDKAISRAVWPTGKGGHAACCYRHQEGRR